MIELRRIFMPHCAPRYITLCLIACSSLSFTYTATADDTKPSYSVEANCVIEIALTSEKSYPDPFNEITLDVVLTAPNGETMQLPAFWAGGERWCFRYASNQPGSHHYRTVCSDAANPGLHGIEGRIEVVAYSGGNPLYRHGPVRVAADRRHFEHVDGTPFFWLGDTWWKGLCQRIPWEGFQQLAADRQRKGFTVVQIVAGPYPDEVGFDPRWENEGGMPYEPRYARVNPRYFDFADRRIAHLVDSGLMPALVGSWGMHLPAIGVEKMKKHWRYLIARYGAYPVSWIVAGEAVDVESWSDVTRYVRALDPYHRMITIHPPLNSARTHVGDRAALDFDMISIGHGSWEVAERAVSELTSSYAMNPPMPVLVGEVCYEGHMLTHWQDFQRFQFWSLMLRGAAGHTYGAGGVWQMNSETVRGSEYEYTPWFEAMNFPGSTQMGLGKALLEEYEWWRFEPHSEWVERRGCAAGIPGEVRFIFIPYKAYDWSPPLIKNLEPQIVYRAFYWEPATGNRFGLGTLVPPTVLKRLFADDFENGDAFAWKDCGTPSRRREGCLTGTKNLLTVVESVYESELMAAVDARSDAEAGIVLHFKDADNYLVALYTLSLKAIYFHNRSDGEYGPPLGKVEVPELGPKIRLTAAVSGNRAAMTVTDGERTYSTPTIKIGSLTRGKVGLWHFQIGDEQQFDNFELSQIHVDPGVNKQQGIPLVLHENPYVGLPAVDVPDVSLLLTDTYTPPRLPAPQDWLLVLERTVP